jgi:multidrug efflux pump subunit AcrA (membrane-fusion protein)
MVLIIAALLFALGTLPRMLRHGRTKDAAREQASALPIVSYVTPRRVVESGVTLPGNIEGGQQTTIQARTNGYISKIYVDIGQPVKRGQVLADIDSPDLAQQITQAQAQTAQARSAEGQAVAALAHAREQLQVQRAEVAQQKAELAQAQSNFKRLWALYGQGYVAKQDAETQYTAVQTSKANVKSAEAAVGAAQADVASAQKGVTLAQAAVRAAVANQRRFEVLGSFTHVTAPFDGVITARNVDEGALVGSGGGAGTTGAGGTGTTGGASSGVGNPTSSSGLFQIANSATVKIHVQVPETFATSVQVGATARVTVRELPGKEFNGEVNQSAGAIDPATRTLRAEVDLPNPTRALLPGMYARVRLTPANPPTALRVPDSALIIDAQGTRVAVVTPDNRVHFQDIRIGRDFGTEAEVVRGLEDDARLISNPSEMLKEGTLVKPVHDEEAEKTAVQSSGNSPGAAKGERRGGGNARP